MHAHTIKKNPHFTHKKKRARHSGDPVHKLLYSDYKDLHTEDLYKRFMNSESYNKILADYWRYILLHQSRV